MKKDKLTNVRLTKSMAKLIGSVILVDSLIIGTFALGGHVPIYQDDKKINQIVETVTRESNEGKEITVSNYFEDEIERVNRVVYYKMPYINNGHRVREVVTVYNNTFGPKKEIKTVVVPDGEPDISYVETYEYNIDLDNFITVKETIYDEALSDTALLMILGMIDTGIISVGNSYIKRKEEDAKEL